MRKLIPILFLIHFSVLAQFTPYGVGLVQQPNPPAAQHYLQITNVEAGTNVVFSPGSRSGTAKINVPSGGGGGSVTTFSSGNLSPLFTTSVANPGTTPALSFFQINQSANLIYSGPSGGGAAAPTFRSLVAADIPTLAYVTSVALSAPSIFTVGGSPVTSSGTLSLTLNAQSANAVFVGPASGGAATPTFRALTPADIGAFTSHVDVIPISLAPGNILAWSGSAWTNGMPGTGGGAGTVTSVALAAPQEFAVSGSPVTTSGTLTFARGNDANFLGYSATNIGTVLSTNVSATNVTTKVLTNSENANAPFLYTDVNGHVQTGIVGIGLQFDSASGTLSNTVSSGGGGSSTNFSATFFDDNVYEIDEEFDQWRGTGSGQFTRGSGWAVTTVGGGGGIVNVNSNMPPYYGLIEIQGSTTPTNGVFVSQVSGSGISIYQNLASATNWLFHGIFFLHVTNIGSIYRFGLADGINSAVGPALFPSNSIGLRWYKNLNDGNRFIFESRSNAISVTNHSSVIVAIDTPYKFDMWSLTNGVVLFSINGETPVAITNTPNQSLSMTAYVSLTNATAGRMWLDRMCFRAVNLGR